MKEYWLYILKCSDKSYYTGVCNNLEKRLGEHHDNTDHTSYLFKRKPFKLVFADAFSQVEDAIAREKQVKRWSRAKKKALIENNWNRLQILARNYTQYGHPSTGSG